MAVSQGGGSVRELLPRMCEASGSHPLPPHQNAKYKPSQIPGVLEGCFVRSDLKKKAGGDSSVLLVLGVTPGTPPASGPCSWVLRNP